MDAYIRRKMSVERYIKGFTNKQLASMEAGDRDILNALQSFLDSASQKDVRALLRDNNSNSSYAALIGVIISTLNNQESTIKENIKTEMPKFVDSEIEFTKGVLKSNNKSNPSGKEIIKEPVSGAAPIIIISVLFAALIEKIKKSIVVNTINNTNPVTALKGTKELKFRDGLFSYRNRNIKADLNTIVQGVEWNARKAAFKLFKPSIMIDWSTILDGATCLRCIKAESNSPYPLDKVPSFPLHPFDRCLLSPVTDDEKPTYAEFFDRQTSEFKQQHLGQTKFDLYKEGLFKITDFVDDSGDIYTLQELGDLV